MRLTERVTRRDHGSDRPHCDLRLVSEYPVVRRSIEWKGNHGGDSRRGSKPEIGFGSAGHGDPDHSLAIPPSRYATSPAYGQASC